MSVKKGTIAVFASTVLRNVLSFGAIAYFSRGVGIGSLGAFFLFQSVLSMLSIPADLGMRVGVEKRLSEGDDPGTIIGSALVFKFGLLVVFSAGILMFDQAIANFIGADIAQLLVVGLLINELGLLGIHTLRGEKRVAETAFFQPLRTVLWALLGVVLVELDVGQNALLYAYIAGLFVAGTIAVWRTDSSIGAPSLTTMRSLFGYSKFATIGSVGGLVYNWADVVLIGFFISQAAVGAYEVAWRVATASLLLSTSVRTAIFPQANDWGDNGNYRELESLIKTGLIASMYFVIPAFVGVLVLGEEILSVVFAVEYPGVALVLAILMIEKLQRAVLLVLIAPMHAIGRVDAGAYTTLVGVVVNLTLNVILIPQFGIVGAAIGTATGALANTVTHSYVLSRYINVRIPMRTFAWCGMASAIMGAILWITIQFIAVRGFVTLGVLVFAGGVVYFLITAGSPVIRDELVNHVQSILI